jgi:hypothetical protein
MPHKDKMKIRKIIVMIAIISQVALILNCSHSHQENASKIDPETIKLIDLYRHEVSYQINKNYELKEKISSDLNPKGKIVFRVMSNGVINNIEYLEKSGYFALDKSAYLAVKRTNPTEPFPKGIEYPYMEIGIVFTPNGVKMK